MRSDSCAYQGLRSPTPVSRNRSAVRKGCTRVLALCLFFAISAVGAIAQERPETGSEKVIRGYVTNYSGDGVSVIDPYHGTLIAEIATGSKPHGVAVAPDGTAVYVSNEGDGTLSIIDPTRNSVAATLPVGEAPNQLEVSADGRYVFVTLHGENALAVVDVARREVIEVVPVGRNPHIALRSPDGDAVYVTSEGDMKLIALDAATWKPRFEVPLFGWPRVLTLSADGRTGYLTMRWLNGVLLIDFEAQRVVDRIAFSMPEFAQEGKDAHGPALTPDGKELWLTTQTSNDVAVISAEDRQLLRRIPVGQDPNWIGFTPDGRRAVVSNTASNDVSIIDTTRHTVVATIPAAGSPKRLAVGTVSTNGRQP